MGGGGGWAKEVVCRPSLPRIHADQMGKQNKKMPNFHLLPSFCAFSPCDDEMSEGLYAAGFLPVNTIVCLYNQVPT